MLIINSALNNSNKGKSNQDYKIKLIERGRKNEEQ